MSREEMMRRYKPRRPEMTIDDIVTPEARERQKAMVQEAKDAMAEKAAGKAYDKIMPSPERYAKGGKVSSASKRADGCAERGKTRGKII